jgi:flavorubredoxin
MAREFIPGVYWIQECGGNLNDLAAAMLRGPHDWYRQGREIHIPQNAYLFVGKKTLLFDTLSPASSDQILAELADILGNRSLDYLVVSHTDTPHAGNTFKILRAYPQTTLVAPRYGDAHELYHLEDALKVGGGDAIDLGCFVLNFHEATFLDAPISVWMSEANTRMLLPVDWIGMPHMDGECLKCVDELDDRVDVDRLLQFHGRVFFWLQYVNASKTIAEIERINRQFNPDIIAPSHGLVIRQDTLRYMDMMKDVVQAISDRGRIGVVG